MQTGLTEMSRLFKLREPTPLAWTLWIVGICLMAATLLDFIPSPGDWIAFGIGFVLGLVGLLLPERDGGC